MTLRHTVTSHNGKMMNTKVVAVGKDILPGIAIIVSLGLRCISATTIALRV